MSIVDELEGHHFHDYFWLSEKCCKFNGRRQIYSTLFLQYYKMYLHLLTYVLALDVTMKYDAL